MPTIFTVQSSTLWNGRSLALLHRHVALFVREIQSMAGVRAILLFDNRGDPLAATSIESFDRDLLCRLGREINDCWRTSIRVRGNRRKSICVSRGAVCMSAIWVTPPHWSCAIPPLTGHYCACQ